MPTAGAFAGRIAELAIATTEWDGSTAAASLTYQSVEAVNDPMFSGSNETADASSNDSGGFKEFVYTWGTGTITFEMVANDNATYQPHVITAFTSKQKRGFRYRARGDSSGDYQIHAIGLVTGLEQTSPKGDVSRWKVTIQVSGAPARSTQ